MYLVTINKWLFALWHFQHFVSFSFCKVLIHFLVGFMPEGLEAYKVRLVLNIPELFQEAPLSVMVILNVLWMLTLEFMIDPFIDFWFLTLFGLLFLVWVDLWRYLSFWGAIGSIVTTGDVGIRIRVQFIGTWRNCTLFIFILLRYFLFLCDNKFTVFNHLIDWLRE